MTEAPSPFDSRGLQFAWDSTSLTLAQDCLWKYKATMIDGWRAAQGNANLTFGGVYATALEHYHKHLAHGVEREEAIRLVVHEALRATWAYNPKCESCGGVGLVLSHPEGVPFSQSLADATSCFCGKPWESDHNTKTRSNLIRTIVWYVDHFEDDPLEVVILPDGEPAVEYSFSLELTDNILYNGHIDRLVRYQGSIYVQDQKTTASTLGAYYFKQFDVDIQMTGYSFGAKALLQDDVRGVVIDAAQVAVGFTRFERGYTVRTPAQLEEWYDDTLYHIEVAHRAGLEGYYPRNRAACGKYGGCVFRDVCARDPAVRDNFLRADFVKSHWNPLKKR